MTSLVRRVLILPEGSWMADGVSRTNFCAVPVGFSPYPGRTVRTMSSAAVPFATDRLYLPISCGAVKVQFQFPEELAVVVQAVFPSILAVIVAPATSIPVTFTVSFHQTTVLLHPGEHVEK